jgi:putative inorganic carbon (hco3(-)) transporter
MARSPSGARLEAAAAAFLLPVVFSTSVSAQAWTPRAAVLLLLAAFGLPRLVPMVRSDARPAALAGVVFLGIAALATALSPQPILSFFGLYVWGTGLLFVAVLVGAWALGASVDESGAALVQNALIAGILVNAVVALIQGAFSLNAEPFTRYDGRAAGLVGNPVHLGALTLGGLALVLPRVRSNAARWGAVAVVFAAAVELSGSRFALGLAVVVAVVALVRWRRRAIVAVSAVGFGLLLGLAVGVAGGTTTGSGRLQAGSESVGTTARLRAWATAGHAVADHPVLGSGPGRFRAATSRYRDLALVRAEGADNLFFDAHNIVVEYATTTGVLGVTALVVWLVMAVRRARGPLLWFALLVLAMHLVEPQSVVTTPLAFLALGVGGRAMVSSLGRVLTAVTAVLVVVAVGAAGRLLFGDFQLRQASLDTSEVSAKRAVNALPPWPLPADIAGRAALFRAVSTHTPDAQVDTLHWDRLATRRDNADPTAWSVLAEAELYFGDVPQAKRDFHEALRWDPWSVRALNGLANAELAGGDRLAAKRALERSLTAEPAQKKARAQLRGL